MSAFLCNPTHIGILSAFVAVESGEDASKIAQILATENLKSIDFRYPDMPRMAAEEFLGMTNQEYINACVNLSERLEVDIRKIPPQRIWGMAQCLEYQCCEHPGYRRSRAARILKDALVSAATKYFCEHQIETGWELTEQEWKERSLL